MDGRPERAAPAGLFSSEFSSEIRTFSPQLGLILLAVLRSPVSNGIAWPDHASCHRPRNPLIALRARGPRERHTRCTTVESPILNGEMTMKTIISLCMLFAVTVAGCTSETPDGDGGDGGGGGEPEQPVPATPEGSFTMLSQFDLATNIPGTAGTVAGYIIDATDDTADPTLFILEKLIAKLPASTPNWIKEPIVTATPAIAGKLNPYVEQFAPSFYGKLKSLARGFGQVTMNFGMLETLSVDAAGNATKTVTGLHFEIDGIEHEFAFADYGIAKTHVEGLSVTLSKTGLVTISEHKVPMKYGQVLKLALDQALIPMIDPASSNLGELFESAVNCDKVGGAVAGEIGYPSWAGFIGEACEAGLTAAANGLYGLLDNIDGAAFEFGLTGKARGVDKNRDGKMDDIVTGMWTGEVSYAGTPAPLAEAKFRGARM
jgi:hypothetical protein